MMGPEIPAAPTEPRRATVYVPPPPTREPVTISRDVLLLLSLVDIPSSARRTLDVLLAIHTPDEGTACISQDEMCAALGASKPTVNKSFRALREAGLAWPVDDIGGCYQLHPLLTNGAVAGPAIAVPEIKAMSPEAFRAVRRARYAAQTQTLHRTA